MSYTLEQFGQVLLNDVDDFCKAYRKHQERDGLEEWPNSMPLGDWLEQFTLFQQGADEE